jgi:MYXO-CTERM domain-containing protein
MGMASASCGSISPGEPALGGTGILIGLGAVGIGLARRRSKKQ